MIYAVSHDYVVVTVKSDIKEYATECKQLIHLK